MLMRSINLGSKNKVPMSALREVIARAGGRDVRSYIQSGNVVFDTDDAPGSPAADDIADATVHWLRDDLGLDLPVIVLPAAEFREMAKRNPFLADGADEDHCHLMVLSVVPDRDRAATLDPERSPGDRAVLAGQALYLHLPNGAARSRWTNDYVDRRLGVVSTARNWRTVRAIVALLDA